MFDLGRLATSVAARSFNSSVRAALVVDRAGGGRSRSSSGSSGSSSSGVSFGSRSGSGSGKGGGAIGLIIVLAVVGFLAFGAFKKFKSKNPAQAAALLAGGGGLLAAGLALAKDFGSAGAAGGTPGTSGGTDVQAGLAAIVAHDPDFEKTAFVATAEKSFFLIQKAWTDQDPDQSRQVMADGVWQTHRQQMEAQKTKGVRNVLEDLGIDKSTIVEASSTGGKDTIGVKFNAHCKDYEVDLVTGKREGGDRSIENWSEVWTYQRASTATTKTGGGTLSQKCPVCGAPLKVDLAGSCGYCKSNIMAGAEDWVLVRIDSSD